MSKKNKTNKIKVNVSPEQKQMLNAAQAATVETNHDNATGSAVMAGPNEKDTRTQKERRADRLALREKALQEALEKNLPFFEGYPAIEFEKDYPAAFKAATTAEKAIPADKIREAKAEIAKSLNKTKTTTQELVEAAKASQQPVANDNLPTAEMDNTETSKDAADLETMQAAEAVEQETTTVTYDGVDFVLDANGDLIRNEGESHKKFGQRKHKYKCAKHKAEKAVKAAEKAEKLAEIEYEGRNGAPPSPSEINKTLPLDIDDEGNAVTEVTETSEKTALDSANVVEQAIMDDEIKVCDDLVAETEAKDTQRKPPKGERYLTQQELEWWEARGGKVPDFVPQDWSIAKQEETIAKVDEMKAENDTTESDTSQEQTPVADTEGDAPTEQADTTTEPAVEEPTPAVETPVEQPSEEVVASVPAPKPKMTPKLVVDNEKKEIEDKKMAESQTDEDRAAAKKFYGPTWTDERATKLTQALIWLNRATVSDKKLREGVEFEGKVSLRTKIRMAMNAAFKYEGEALNTDYTIFTVADIDNIYGKAKQEAKAA